MCQPKPGPRCSAHARSALESKRVAKEQAENARTETQAAFRACDPNDRETRERLRQAAVTADKAFWDANRAHTEALRDFETTPEGMDALEQAAARFDEEGNPHAANEVRRRLDEAKATRAEQVADLAMSRRHKDRLANPTVEELAALDQADAEVADKERDLAEKSEAYRAAHEAWSALAEEARAADRAEAVAQRALTEATDAAKNARASMVAEAKRLYVAAGVSERFAGFYAQDMAEAASRTGTRPRFGYDRYSGGRTEDAGPQRAAVVKVKRDGPDREKTLSAKAAAETDTAFQDANTRMVEAAEQVKAAKATVDQIRRDNAPVRDRRQEALSQSSIAKYAMEDAAATRDKAAARREDLRARIGSGLGADPTATVDMRRLGDEVVRNPDGTTNAYVYNGPSEGFPHGRYIPATGVTTVHGMGAANALVLENGRKAWLHGHYSRSTPGGGREAQSGYHKVVIVPPQDGATPLRNEGVANAGFYTFIDSTD